MTLAEVLPLVERLDANDLAELHETTGRWLDESDASDEATARLLDERRAAGDAHSDQWLPWEDSMRRLRQYAAELLMS
jgi:hypothetical protein